VEELFHEAAALSGEARAGFLSERCRGDAALRAEVEALLAEPGTEVDRAAADAMNLMDEGEGLPSAIGPFKIVGLIGEGGMGRVYEAEQDEPRRRVALKMIRPGLLSRAALRRFRHEADVLASLRHPGIAQILQAGSVAAWDGTPQPYIAMELVKGAVLTEHARKHRLSARERMELLARVCDAVQHAHQRGVIHRDLKPGNVLVEEAEGERREAKVASGVATPPSRSSTISTDGAACPKILDFGIARLTGQEDDATRPGATVVTQTGQIVGTLAYMSPEQVEGDSGLLDTRSDVYALGVIGYELLGGKLPLDVVSKSMAAAMAMIREQEPVRLGTIDASLRGDVETIIAKAMEKDRERRYGSAGELGADIRRWLNDEPIAARPASSLYQLRKFARRNRPLVWGAAAVVAALAVGATVATVSAVRESHAKRLAEAAAQRANLSAALADIQGGNARSARRRLEEVKPEQRGWEWRYLSRQCASAVARIDAAPLRNAAVIPARDGTPGRPPDLLLCFADGSARRWRVGIDELPEVIPAGGSVILAASASPDGRVLLVLTDRTLRAVETDSGRELWRRESVASLGDPAFSRDGTTVVVEASDSQLAFVEAGSGRELRRIDVREGGGKTPRFAPATDGPAGSECVVFNTVLETMTVDPRSGGVLHSAPVWAGTVVGDGAAIIGLRQGDAARVELRTGQQTSIAPVGPSRMGLPDPEGRWIAVADPAGSFRVHDARAAVLLGWLHDPTQRAFGRTVCSRDGQWLAAIDGSGARWWDMNAVREPLMSPRTYDTVLGSSVSRDGTRVATLGWGSLRVWDATSGQLLWTRILAGSDRAVRAEFSPDGSRILAAGWEGVAAVCDVADGRLVWSRRIDGTNVRSVGWMSGGREGLVGDAEGRLRVLDAETGEERALGEPGAGAGSDGRPRGGVLALATSHGAAGRVIAVMNDGSVVEGTAPAMRDAAVLMRLPGVSDGVGCLGTSEDGRWLVAGVGMWDGSARVLDRREGREWRLSEQIGVGVRAAAFDPEGTRLVLSCMDGLIRVMDPRTREERIAISASAGNLGAIALVGDRLTVVGSSAPVVVFDASPDAAMTRRWALAGRAREIVDDLFDEVLYSETVLAKLDERRGMDPELRTAAIAAARGRGDQYNQINSRAWEIVRYPGRPADELKLAESFAELCHRAQPDRFAFANTLGASYYRAGRFEDAVRMCEESDRLAVTGGREPHPMNAAFIAMSLARLGRMDEARGRWAQAMEGASMPAFAADPEMKAVLKEGAEVVR
jgi:serine/threonine protein kinase/WD40 repeat protein